MTSRPKGPLILEVTFESREDGGLRAYCDAVPAFVLSHSNADMVRADVVPALELILSEMYGMPMRVCKAETIAQSKMPEMPAFMCGAAQYVGLSQAN